MLQMVILGYPTPIAGKNWGDKISPPKEIYLDPSGGAVLRYVAVSDIDFEEIRLRCKDEQGRLCVLWDGRAMYAANLEETNTYGYHWDVSVNLSPVPTNEQVRRVLEETRSRIKP